MNSLFSTITLTVTIIILLSPACVIIARYTYTTRTRYLRYMYTTRTLHVCYIHVGTLHGACPHGIRSVPRQKIESEFISPHTCTLLHVHAPTCVRSYMCTLLHVYAPTCVRSYMCTLLHVYAPTCARPINPRQIDKMVGRIARGEVVGSVSGWGQGGRW